jgi:hypothetical protein
MVPYIYLCADQRYDRLQNRKKTHDITDKLLVSRNDGAPRIWVSAIYAVRILRVGTTAWEMRDGGEGVLWPVPFLNVRRG